MQYYQYKILRITLDPWKLEYTHAVTTIIRLEAKEGWKLHETSQEGKTLILIFRRPFDSMTDTEGDASYRNDDVN